MVGKGKIDAYKKGVEAREELKSYAMKSAYEITREIERWTKVKLTFDQFNFIFDRLNKMGLQGFGTATILAYTLFEEIIENH